MLQTIIIFHLTIHSESLRLFVSVEHFLEKVSALYYFEYAMFYSSQEAQTVKL